MCGIHAQLLSHVQLLVTPWTVAQQAPLSMDFPGKKKGVGSISFSRNSSQPRDWTRVSSDSCIGRWVLNHWATWEAQVSCDAAIILDLPGIYISQLQLKFSLHKTEHATVSTSGILRRVKTVKLMGFSGASVVENPPAKAAGAGSRPGSRRPLQEETAATPVFLPGKCRG